MESNTKKIQKANANESKRDKFKRLAESRVNRVLENLRILSNLSSKRNYDYTEEDVRKIFKSIDDGVKKVRMKFESSLNLKKFSLD